jgi:hypothetical protein
LREDGKHTKAQHAQGSGCAQINQQTAEPGEGWPPPATDCALAAAVVAAASA